MKKETKESTPKQRIVVIEKGKAIVEAPDWYICCWAQIFPIRAG